MHKPSLKYHGLICTALALGVLATPAKAQQAVDEPEKQTRQEMDGTKPPASSGNTSIQLAPVTVTAQRRTEQALDVPISMQTFDRIDMETRGAKDLSDVTNVAPNVSQYGDNANFGISSIVIRGIATQGGSMTGSDQAIGVYVDDIFMGTQAGMNPLLEDADRVEILRGPQGTLYGRNVIGGAVNIISAQPEPTPYLSGQAMYGSDQLYEVSAVANGKVADVTDGAVSARVNAFQGGRGHTVDNALGSDLGDYDKTGGKAQLRYQRGNVDAVIRTDYTDQDGSAWALAPFNEAPSRKVSYVNPFEYEVEDFGLSANAKIQLGALSLQSITGWRGNDSDLEGGNWTSSTSVQQGYDRQQRQLSQEFRLASEDSARLRWISGLYFFYNDEYEHNYYGHRLGSPALWGMFSNGEKEASRSSVMTNSQAMFGEATYGLTDWLDGTIGGRLSHDYKSTDYSNDSQLGLALAQSLEDDMDHIDFSPKFNLTAKVDNDVRFYATASKGYKSGGFNRQFAPTNKLDFKPERVWNYEIGNKMRLLGGRAETNASFFYADWHNQQVNVSRIVSGAIVNDVSNVPHSRSYGGELDGTFRATSDLTIGGSFGWTEATFVDFPNPTTTIASGNDFRQPYAPRFTYGINAQYLVPLRDQFDLMLRADYIYRTNFYHDITNQMHEPGYGLFNLKAAILTDGWEISAFVKNLTDEGYRTRALMYNGQAWAIAGDGRTVGLQGKVEF